jgi:hypothetical protein
MQPFRVCAMSTPPCQPSNDWKLSNIQRRLRSTSLSSPLLSPVTSSLLGPNILSSTLFSNTLNPCSSLNVRDKVRFQVLTAATVFWKVVFCRLVEIDRRLGGTYFLYHQWDHTHTKQHVKLFFCIFNLWSRGSSVSAVFGYGLGDRGSIPGRGWRIFPLASVSRPALRPTQPPVQWVPGVLSSRVKRGRGVTLTTHPHLVPRSRMRSYTSSPPPSASMACSGTALLTVFTLYLIYRLHFQTADVNAKVLNCVVAPRTDTGKCFTNDGKSSSFRNVLFCYKHQTMAKAQKRNFCRKILQ